VFEEKSDVPGPEGEEHVQNLLIKKLPDGSGASTPAELHRQLLDIKSTNVMKYCSRGGQGRLEALLDKVSALKMGIPVCTQAMDTSDFFGQALGDQILRAVPLRGFMLCCLRASGPMRVGVNFGMMCVCTPPQASVCTYLRNLPRSWASCPTLSIMTRAMVP
jgi:hypothetical protein